MLTGYSMHELLRKRNAYVFSFVFCQATLFVLRGQKAVIVRCQRPKMWPADWLIPSVIRSLETRKLLVQLA